MKIVYEYLILAALLSLVWTALRPELWAPLLPYSVPPAQGSAAFNAQDGSRLLTQPVTHSCGGWYWPHLLVISRCSCPNIVGIRAKKIVTG